jgi:hypothetical protein
MGGDLSTSLNALALLTIRPASHPPSPSFWSQALDVLPVLFFPAMLLLVFGLPFAHKMRKAARLRTIKATWKRVAAVVLSEDEGSRNRDTDERAVDVVAELSPMDGPKYRVEIKEAIDDDVTDLLEPEASFFAFVDPADPNHVVIDVEDLRAREAEKERERRIRHAEDAAAAERKRVEERERLLRGG